MWCAVVLDNTSKGEDAMTRRFLCDSAGCITAEIEADSPVLAAALEHEKAESVVRCAVLMALSALAEGGAWPATVLQAMAVFMGRMKSEIDPPRYPAR
jgi:hypothetical protein